MTSSRISATFPVWHKYPEEKPVATGVLYLCVNNDTPEVMMYYSDRDGFASLVRKKTTTTCIFERVNVSFFTELLPLFESLKKDFSK